MSSQRDPQPVGEASPGQQQRLTVDLADQSVLVLLISLTALVAIWGIVQAASGAVTLIVVGLFLAMALDPVVNAVERRAKLGRAPAVIVVLFLGLILLLSFLA
ncbi:MAG: hypothetical protein WD029_08335, partial [Microthrixaceae bacterium]